MDIQEKIEQLAELFARRATIDEQIRCVIEDEEYEEEEEEEGIVEVEPPAKSKETKSADGGKMCGVDGCEKKHAAKGMCSMHYMRDRKGGAATKESDLISVVPKGKMAKMYCEECDWEFEYPSPTLDAVCPKCNSVHVKKSLLQ